jgi:hypothetical protein
MPYLGSGPATAYASFERQNLTGNGGTSYTLDHSVGNEQEIEVFVNNVRQEPGSAYTVSGTALTMTGNVESTDDFYIVFQGKAVQTATHPDSYHLKAVDGTFTGTVEISGNTPFWENKSTVDADYTITNNRNAFSIGPITISDGVTVTVGSGETWTVV